MLRALSASLMLAPTSAARLIAHSLLNTITFIAIHFLIVNSMLFIPNFMPLPYLYARPVPLYTWQFSYLIQISLLCLNKSFALFSLYSASFFIRHTRNSTLSIPLECPHDIRNASDLSAFLSEFSVKLSI